MYKKKRKKYLREFSRRRQTRNSLFSHRNGNRQVAKAKKRGGGGRVEAEFAVRVSRLHDAKSLYCVLGHR